MKYGVGILALPLVLFVSGAGIPPVAPLLVKWRSGRRTEKGLFFVRNQQTHDGESVGSIPTLTA